MLSRKKISIAVVGAGIGGLAAAAALRKHGIEATVYEQADKFTRAGAGVQQSPNAVKVLRGLGLEDRLRAMAFAPASLLSREATTGKITNEYPLGQAVEDRFGAPYLTLHRGDLHAVLAAAMPAEYIKLGRRVTGIVAAGPRVVLEFARGPTVEADAIIGADGVHSLVREHVAGALPVRFTGHVAHRATFPASRLLGTDIGLSQTKWLGRDRHIAINYVTAARDEIHFAASHPVPPGRSPDESWSAIGDLAELRNAFISFRSDVQAVLSSAPEVYKSGVYERAPLAAWSRGRVVLLGDACHPMTPYMAAAAAMALEDAVVLARCIGDDDCDSFEAAFRTYEMIRKPRAGVVQAGSSANTWMRKETNPDWLYGYDAWRIPLRSENASAMEALTWEA